jgi:hypothetical protein
MVLEELGVEVFHVGRGKCRGLHLQGPQRPVLLRGNDDDAPGPQVEQSQVDDRVGVAVSG